MRKDLKRFSKFQAKSQLYIRQVELSGGAKLVCLPDSDTDLLYQVSLWKVKFEIRYLSVSQFFDRDLYCKDNTDRHNTDFLVLGSLSSFTF